jgi:diacylglycerol O-acyltransferase / wax synthase
MLTNYPTSIVVHGMALNITVQSYDQSLDFGLMADGVAMPDVRELADAILIAFDDVKALPLPGEHAEEDEPAASAASSVGRLVGRARRTLDSAVSAAADTAGKVVPKAVLRAAAPARRKNG